MPTSPSAAPRGALATLRCATKRGFFAVLLGVLMGQLACAHAPEYRADLSSLSSGRPAADADVQKAMRDDKRQSTLWALEQGFAKLRHAKTPEDLRAASQYLDHAHQSFEDLKDPANMSEAFSADADTPYRGRPHERVLTATTLAVLDMAAGRCDMALPALRSAEFLDARWQPFPYGTDAPLVYALMLRCLHLTQASPGDVNRARQGLLLSLRLQLAAGPMQEVLDEARAIVARGDALSVKLAAVLMKQGIPAALMSDPRAHTAPELIKSAAAESRRHMRKTLESLDDPAVQAAASAIARVQGGGEVHYSAASVSKAAEKQLEPALASLQSAMRFVAGTGSIAATKLAKALDGAAALATRIEAAATAPVMVLGLAGVGPSVAREGEYDEVAIIKPGAGARNEATIRALDDAAVKREAGACGIQAVSGTTVAVLCAPGVTPDSADFATYENLELFSASYQATSVVGRRFDKILKGRAAFKGTADDVREIATVSAWILFRVSLEVLGACNGKEIAACAVIALAVFAVALLTGAIALTAWGIGAAVNPAADPRYVHSLFESGTILVPAGAAGGAP